MFNLSLINAMRPIEIKLERGNYAIYGINIHELMFDMTKGFGTSRVDEYLRGDIKNGYKLTFEPFFLYDVYFIVNFLITENIRSRRVPKRHLIKLREKLEEGPLKDFFNEPPLKYDNGGEKISVLKPMKHQSDFHVIYDKMIQRCNLEGYLLNSDPGTGKTLNSIMLAFKVMGRGTKIFVVPKLSLFKPWVETFENGLTEKIDYWHSGSGTLPPEGKEVYIIHYDYLTNFMSYFSKFKVEETFVTVDECHNFNDPKSQRSEALVELKRMIPKSQFLFMSGTPFKALGKEAITMLRCIDRTFTPDVEPRFSKLFGKSNKRAVEILAHRLGVISHKISGDEMKGDKPIYKEIKVRIPNAKEYTLESIAGKVRDFIVARTKHYKEKFDEYEKFYNQCMEIVKVKTENDQHFKTYQKYIAILRKGYDPKIHKTEAMYCNDYEKRVIDPILPVELRYRFRDAKSVIKYVHLKIQGEALGTVIGRARSQCLMDMLPHIDLRSIINEGVKKSLVFTSYVNVVDTTEAILREQGLKPLKVYGDTNKDLKNIIDKFYKDETINPLIATFQSLSTAVPIICANQVIMINVPFRSIDEEQAIARAWRLGQDTQVYVYKLFLDTGNLPNISTRSKDILEWSRDMVNSLLGIREDGSVSDVGGLESFVANQVAFEEHHEYLDDIEMSFENFELPSDKPKVSLENYSW